MTSRASAPRRAAPALLIAVACAAALPAPAAASDIKAELLEELRQRDAEIRALEARIEALENRTGGPAPRAPTAVPPGSAAAAATPPPADARAATAPPAGSGPAFEVDPEAAERALERTLTDVGTLLLPEGRADVSPFMSYQYSDTDAYRVVFADVDGDGVAEAPLTDALRARRDEFDMGVDVRLGLPYDSQVELRVPATVARREADSALLPETRTSTGAGFGNIRLGLAKTILREEGIRPDVIGRVTYTAPTGTVDSDGLVLNSDFHRLEGSVTLLKRQDPLAFSARFSYEEVFAKDGLDPGGQIGASLGTFLALSPETSLNFGFSYAHRGELELNGAAIGGSAERQVQATFGVSSIIARDMLLNLSFGVGMTEDTPDFTFLASVPLRFGVW